MKSVFVKSVCLIAFLNLAACAQNAKVAKIDNSQWTELQCSGFLTWHACREQARAICPNGFYTADYFENYTIQRREISVACKT